MKENENTTENVIDYTINQRIKELIEDKLGVTVYEFSKKLGNKRADGIYKIIKNEVSPSPKTLQKIYDVFPEHEYWLKNGETEEDLRIRLGGRSIDENYTVPKKDSVTQVSNDGYMEVEFRDLSVAAGPLSMTDQKAPKKTMLVPREYDKGEYLVVRVEGPSMEDGSIYSIPNGANILIKRIYLENGDRLPIRDNLFVIDAKEGQALKQIIEHNTEEGYIICHSYNPEFNDYRVNLEDVFGFYIFRKIVGFRPPVRGI